MKFAARLEELGPTFARDHQLGDAVGAKSGTVFYVELPLSSVRAISAAHPLALPVAGGVRGVPSILAELSAL